MQRLVNHTPPSEEKPENGGSLNCPDIVRSDSDTVIHMGADDNMAMYDLKGCTLFLM